MGKIATSDCDSGRIAIDFSLAVLRSLPMAFVCDACNSTVPVARHRAGQRLRCPHCGGSVTFHGMKSARSAPREEEPAITLTRAEPTLRRAGKRRAGPSWELAVGAGVVAVVLFLLMGAGLFLVTRALAQPVQPAAIASATETPARE